MLPRLPTLPDPTRPARYAARLAARRAGGVWDRFADWFNGLEPQREHDPPRLREWPIGVGAGLGVVAFYRLIDLAFWIFYLTPAVWLTQAGILAYRPLLTGLGLVWAHLIMRGPGRGHEGLTVPDVQRAVAREGGRLPTRPALARTAASAVTLGSGGAAGSEGPVAVLGAALASFLGSAFRFDPARTKVLVAAGAAAGISAAFNAPLAGAFFALEEILGSLAVGAFPSVVVASVVAAVVSHIFLGNNPAFPVPEEYGYALQREVLIFYPFLGVVAGLVAVLFVRVFFAHGEASPRRSKVHAGGWRSSGECWSASWCSSPRGCWWATATWRCTSRSSGACAGRALALLALGSILATSITLTFGGSGGVFTPSLFVGAATGGSFGVALADALSRARPPARGVRTGGHGRGGRRRHRRADHRHAAGVRDDQRLRHRPAAHADHGDRQPGGAAARSRTRSTAGGSAGAASGSSTAPIATCSPDSGWPTPSTRRRTSWGSPRRWTSCWSTWGAAPTPISPWWTSTGGWSASSPLAELGRLAEPAAANRPRAWWRRRWRSRRRP